MEERKRKIERIKKMMVWAEYVGIVLLIFNLLVGNYLIVILLGGTLLIDKIFGCRSLSVDE